jgi:signal transduction histidine kinase
VRTVELAGVVAAASALAAAILGGALLRRRAVPAGVARLAQAIPEALGDAVLALDRSGRILLANSAAARLAGTSVAALVDRDVAELAPDLAALARGIERGPASARLALPGPAGPVRVRAALVRVSARPPVVLAVLRVIPGPVPPPLPPRAGAPWPEGGDGRAGLAAAAEALRHPVAHAADALSLLRLGAPPLGAGAAAALAAAEGAVEAAVRCVAAMAAAGQPGAPRRPVDLAALVEDVVATFPPPPGVRVTFDLAASRALADERPVRAALREILGAAAGELPEGGEIAVGVRERGAVAIVEVRTPGGVEAGGLALARALVVPQGGRVEDEAAPGSGAVVRVALEGARALAPA